MGDYYIKRISGDIPNYQDVVFTIKEGNHMSFQGCNFNSGEYTLSGNTFKVKTPWLSTLVFCEDDIDPQIIKIL